MISTTSAAVPQTTQRTVARGVGLPGRIAVSWTAAGGLLLGGFLVAAMTLAGRLSGNELLLTSGGLFLVGGVLGFAHGAVLGWMGRPDSMGRRQAGRCIALAAVYAIPVLAVGLVVAGWIAMPTVVRFTGGVVPMVLSAAAWATGAVVVAMAAAYGWRGIRNAYARWPQRRLGTVLVAASYAALLVIFLAERPVIWGIRMRVTETGAFVLAAFAALWVLGPIVTVALRLARDLRLPEAVPGHASPLHTAASVAIGLAAGVVLGLLALPFTGATLLAGAGATGPLGGVAAAASHALIDEVLLRLFVTTAVAWVLLHWHGVHRVEAAAAAVGVSALAQVALYLPGVVEIGFPGLAQTLAFTGLVVLLPAVVFGVLFWLRGLGTAVLAHATALAVLVLLAA